jgi:hypothetical protein
MEVVRVEEEWTIPEMGGESLTRREMGEGLSHQLLSSDMHGL